MLLSSELHLQHQGPGLDPSPLRVPAGLFRGTLRKIRLLAPGSEQTTTSPPACSPIQTGNGRDSRSHTRTRPTPMLNESSESRRLSSLTFLTFRRAVRPKLRPFPKSPVQMWDQTAHDRSAHVSGKWFAGPDSLQTQPITSLCYVLRTRGAL